MPTPKKKHTGSNDALYTLVEANSLLAAGMAEAIAAGFIEFNRAMQAGDPTKPGFDNPILKGSLAGSLKAMDKSLESVRKVARVLFAPNIIIG